MRAFLFSLQAMKYSKERDGREGIVRMLVRKIGDQEKDGETPLNWHQLKHQAKLTT